MVRPLNAARVVSTNPDSLRVSVWMAICTSISSATLRQLSMAAGVVPQSSCNLSPKAPARTCSRSGSGWLALPFPDKPEIHGESLGRLKHAVQVPGSGGEVVAFVPAAGPVPPPIMVVMPDMSASSICCGQMKWNMGVDTAGGDEHPFAGNDFGAGADNNRDPGLDIRVTRLADPGNTAALEPYVGLDDPPVIDDQGIGTTQSSTTSVPLDPLALSHAIPDHLAAAEFYLFAVDGKVPFDLYPEVGVGQPDAVSHRGTVHLRHACRSMLNVMVLPSALPLPGRQSRTLRSPSSRTSSTVRSWTRLKTHRRTGGDVEPNSVGHAPVKCKCAVGFSCKKMIVRTDLVRPVPLSATHRVTTSRPPRFRIILPVCRRICRESFHFPPLRNRVVYGYQLGPVGKRGLNLNFRNHLRNPFQ